MIKSEKEPEKTESDWSAEPWCLPTQIIESEVVATSKAN